ncbi:hypothetical protein B7463_g8904, partial [Scytalidium lignicola]
MVLRQLCSLPRLHFRAFGLILGILLLASHAHASVGDKLPEFKECVEVCINENCGAGDANIPIFHRLLLWDCPSECDYTCQHIITDRRVVEGEEVVQFHGKWPFYRFLGMQEPFSVLFSFLNFSGHHVGLAKIKANIPAFYPLRQYYIYIAYLGMASWTFSMIFHTRDFTLTEQLDYFGAGANVLYGLYYSVVRVFRLDQGGKKTRSVLKAWTLLCITLYLCHVAYLKWYTWDYTYNMAANVVVGIFQNILWSWFSIDKYRKSKRTWAAWPGLMVAWLLVAMSLELLDFPPWLGCIDAHSLWHLGTVVPTFVMYNFLLKDAEDDIARTRLKA